MRPTIRISTLRVLFCLAFCLARPASGQSMADLRFLAGCWQGPFSGGGTMEEFYTAPSDNLILGTTRYLREGRAVQFEFSRIGMNDGVIELLPYPGGKPSEDAFRLTKVDETEAVFEAPEHDFPKRIIYRIEGPGTRVARIDGGAGSEQVMEWRLQSVQCSSGAR